MLQWESITKGAATIHRATLHGRTVAAIMREGDAARIVAVTRHGGEYEAQAVGDTLEENKRTAREMLQAEGINPDADRLDVFRKFYDNMKGQ